MKVIAHRIDVVAMVHIGQLHDAPQALRPERFHNIRPAVLRGARDIIRSVHVKNISFARRLSRPSMADLLAIDELQRFERPVGAEGDLVGRIFELRQGPELLARDGTFDVIGNVVVYLGHPPWRL